MQTHGLFGSDEWWQKVESGKLPIRTVIGSQKVFAQIAEPVFGLVK